MIIVRKSTRKRAKLRLGIAAPGGAGKTMGALFLAYGLTGDWSRIGLLDTEEGSGELYSDKIKNGMHIQPYNYASIQPPYTVAKYLEGIHALEQCSDVVIIDSLSHAWAGTGGLLDKQGKIADSTKNSYTAWRFVTPEHMSLVDAMLQSPRHIIATMRSKQEYVLETNDKGKQAPRKVGMAPVQREGMEYEFTVMLDIDDKSVARATKDRTDLFSVMDGAGRLEKREFMITPKIGEELLNWLNTGVESIEALSERMAVDIAASNDLEATYAVHAETMARIEAERPTWKGYIVGLFEKRDAELKAGKA